MGKRFWPFAKGETAALIRAVDWSATSLGATATWPQSLRTTVDIVLEAPVAMLLLYGRDRVQIYNDLYGVMIGEKHPAAFAMRSEDCWPLSWQKTQDATDAVFRGQSVVLRDESAFGRPRGAAPGAYLETSYFPVRDEGGTVVAALAVATIHSPAPVRPGEIVGPPSRTEAEWHDLTADLRAEVARQSAKLHDRDEALRQSRAMAVIGRLTAGIAHDFNNLMQGVVGSLEMVEKKIVDRQVYDIGRWVTGAISSANRAAALTQRLLAVSRSGEPVAKSVDVNALIASLRDPLIDMLGPSIDLDFVPATELWLTYCDAHGLQNAIVNAIVNAREAMPDGGRVTIATSNSQVGAPALGKGRNSILAQFICIAISDTGAGMSPDVAKRAFEPFFTTKPTGQGIGLSTLDAFARRSAGYAKIESGPGGGATIRVFLPSFDDRADAKATPAEAGIECGQGGETVLVVENEPVVRGLIIDVLDDLGYRGLEARDAPSALDILNGEPKIELLITDIGLPGQDGRQLAAAAKLTRPDLKILFMTGHPENFARANGMASAGMQMIAKPFTIEALAVQIRDMISANAA